MAGAEQQVEEKFALTTSRGFPAWLARSGGSLVFTTYQAGKVFLLGTRPDGCLAVFERTFPRCMGLGVSSDGRSFVMATHFQIYRFDNVLAPGQTQQDTDAVYVPHQSWITGDLDVHDIVFRAGRPPLFVNTLFSCLATASEDHSFRPVWRPPFISRLAAEDRCHLNGIAVDDEGEPVFATAVATTDVADGWRDKRSDGGVVVDVVGGEIVVEGLSMPHSPRLRGGTLWLLNSGSGELLRLDPKTLRFEPVAFCPGYARGLAFAGDHAVVGLSLPRETRTFQGLPLDDMLKRRRAEPRCGLLVIDLEKGDAVEWVRIEGVVRELYDVAFVPGAVRPMAIGLKTDEIKRIISIDETPVE